MPDTAEEPTLSDVMAAVKAQSRELRETREELRQVKRELREERELVPVGDLADELGVSRRTIYRRLETHEIPRRGAQGYPKESGDTTASYVSRTEWESRGEVATRAVRENAGFY